MSAGIGKSAPPRHAHAPAASAIVLMAATMLAGAAPAQAAPPASGGGIWSLQWDNSSIAGGSPTDRNYTNGLRLGWTSPVGEVPGPMSRLGHLVWGAGEQRLSVGVMQQIFTPTDTQSKPPNPLDRPYAGYLAVSLGLDQVKDNTLSVLGLTLGVIGPPAGGEPVQNGFHHWISQGTNRGWGYQLRTEPTIELTAGRTWRVPLGPVWPTGSNGIEADVLPAISGGLGNVRIYGESGITFRFGRDLGADFGVPQLPPGPGGRTAFHPSGKFGWYVFVGIDGQAVGHDLFLDGNTFRSGPHVTRDRFLGEAEAGIAVIYHGIRISYTQVVQTRSFQGQHGSPFNYGMLSLAGRF